MPAPPCSVRKSMRSAKVEQIQTARPRCGRSYSRYLRVALGAFFVSTFFENLGKELYTAEGYAGLIRYYIQYGHAPAVWKQVMGFTAAHAAIAGPMQAVLEASLGVFLILGFLLPACRAGGIRISDWAVGLRVGNRLDMGAAGSNGRSCWRCSRTVG